VHFSAETHDGRCEQSNDQMRGISWLGEQLLVYQEGVSCMELVVSSIIKIDHAHIT
jgi:hypothetical protein